MNDNIITPAMMTSAVFRYVDKDAERETNVLFSAWEKTLLAMDFYNKKSRNMMHASEEEDDFTLKNGQRILDHSEIVDLKNGILIVETDHPGWSELIKLNQNFIIRGLNYNAKDLKITNIATRLKGMKGRVSDREKNEIKNKAVGKLKESNSNAEKVYQQYTKENKTRKEELKTTELPEELKDIFSKMMMSVKN